jgi:hypothetical protein
MEKNLTKPWLPFAAISAMGEVVAERFVGRVRVGRKTAGTRTTKCGRRLSAGGSVAGDKLGAGSEERVCLLRGEIGNELVWGTNSQDDTHREEVLSFLRGLRR